MLDLLRLFWDKGIAYKQTTVDVMQVKIDCPVCRGHEKCWVRLDSQTMYCFKCQWRPADMSQFLYRLLKSGGKTTGREILRIQNEYDRVSIPEGDAYREFVEKRLQEGETKPESRGSRKNNNAGLELPPFYTLLDDPKVRAIARYAYSRGVPESVMREHQWGGCWAGPFNGYLILPAYERGRLMFWQGREALGRAKMVRYRTPSGFSSNHCLFNIDEASTYDEVIICEGYISAIKTGKDAVATFGNKISKGQIEKLQERGVNNVVLCFDPDTWKVPDPVLKRTGGGRPPIYSAMMRLLGQFESVRVACLLGGDPDELGQEGTRDAIAAAKGISSTTDILTMIAMVQDMQTMRSLQQVSESPRVRQPLTLFGRRL